MKSILNSALMASLVLGSLSFAAESAPEKVTRWNAVKNYVATKAAAARDSRVGKFMLPQETDSKKMKAAKVVGCVAAATAAVFACKYGYKGLKALFAKKDVKAAGEKAPAEGEKPASEKTPANVLRKPLSPEQVQEVQAQLAQEARDSKLAEQLQVKEGVAQVRGTVRHTNSNHVCPKIAGISAAQQATLQAAWKNTCTESRYIMVNQVLNAIEDAFGLTRTACVTNSTSQARPAAARSQQRGGCANGACTR